MTELLEITDEAIRLDQLEEFIDCEFDSPACKHARVEWLWLCKNCDQTLRACVDCKRLHDQIVESEGVVTLKCCEAVGKILDLMQWLPIGGA